MLFDVVGLVFDERDSPIGEELNLPDELLHSVELGAKAICALRTAASPLDQARQKFPLRLESVAKCFGEAGGVDLAGIADCTAAARGHRDLLDVVLELVCGRMKLGAAKVFEGKGSASEFLEEWSSFPQGLMLEVARAWLG